MSMTTRQYNELVDQVARMRLLPGKGIQLGKYAAGQAVSVSRSTVAKRRGRVTQVIQDPSGYKSMLAIVTARVTSPVLGLEWRQVVMQGSDFRLATPDEVEYINISQSPGWPDMQPLPQEGFAMNLRDMSVTGPSGGPYTLSYNVNPWTPMAGDIIRVWIGREGYLDINRFPKRFICEEVMPVRSEKIIVTWSEYVDSTHVRPHHYWLNRSLIGEPDIDNIVESSYKFYQPTPTAGQPRQTGIHPTANSVGVAHGPFLIGGVWGNILQGTDAGYSLVAGATPSDSNAALSSGVTFKADGTRVVAWYSYISTIYKLNILQSTTVSPYYTLVQLDEQATAHNVQHVACDSAGVVHILARNSSTGAYRYVTSDGVAEVPTTTTSPCALAISPDGVPTILGVNSTATWGVMQRINGAWVTTPLDPYPAVLVSGVDLAFGSDGTAHYTVVYRTYSPVYTLRIGNMIAGVDSHVEYVATTGNYTSESRVRLSVSATGYPVVAVSRWVSGNNYECDLWMWRRDGLNDTFQVETIGNPYQLGGVHVLGGRGYNQ